LTPTVGGQTCYASTRLDGKPLLLPLVDTLYGQHRLGLEEAGMLAVAIRDAAGAGRVLLVEAATGTVRWDVVSCPYQPSSFFLRVAMSPDGIFVASVSDSEENWKLWDTASGAAWMTGAEHHGTGACVCGVARMRGEEVDVGCPLQAHTKGVCVVAFSPCGRFFATGGKDRAVILWNAQTGNAEHVMQGHTHLVISLAFSAGGGKVASGSFDGSILLWDAKTGTLLRTIDAHPNSVMDLHFSPTNSSKLVSVGVSVKQWDVDTGQLYKTFAGWYFCQFSPDGRTIATASNPGVCDVILLDAESGDLRLRLVGHQSYVKHISWSPDGSKLASGSDDCTCKVWDSSIGALLRTIQLDSQCWSLSWGRDWVQDTQRAMAFAMGHHPRLGGESQVIDLEVGVVRMIVDLA